MKRFPLRSPRLCILVASVFSGQAWAADGFEKVRCDQPIAPALVGVHPNASEPVVRTEARRRAIGLKHLGADIITDRANTIRWRICGRTFVVLEDRDLWRDAVELPLHSRDVPAFSTTSCEVGGRKVEGVFIGLFSTRPTDSARFLPVKVGWRIDLKAGRFVPLDAPTTCATDGIDADTDPT